MKNDILRQLKKIPVIDSHEHLPHEKDLRSSRLDVIDLMTPYVCDNLMSCGLSETDWKQANNKALPFEQRYAMIEKYLNHIRHTTYFKSMLKGAMLCFGMQDFSLAECKRVNLLLESGLDTEALFASCGIKKAMTFVSYYGLDYFSDSKLMIPVPTVSLMTPKTPNDIQELSAHSGIEVRDTESLQVAIGSIFGQYEGLGLKNIKIGASYNRVPDYVATDRRAAEAQLSSVAAGKICFDKVYGQNNLNLPHDKLKALDDLVINTCIDLARDKSMNTVIHTGIHAWNKNDVKACHAEPLSDVIASHPDQKFTLLHMGYPYIEEVLLLCKYYPNVYLDLAWLHTLDRRATVDTVKRVIELLPTNKIVGFGGDVCLPVNTVGNLHFALENLAEAFSDMIKSGELTASDADEIGYAWLYENPVQIDHLDV